jgi:hypothetical protein
MSLLAAAPRVAFDRVYPFEHRYLTYLAKLALLLERQDPNARVTPHQLYDFADTTFGSYPWDAAGADANGPGTRGSPFRTTQSLRRLWQAFCEQVAPAAPGAAFYAEKVPYWLPPLARECFPAYTIYLFRDPRDIYLSANAFMRKRGRPGFDRSPADTDLDYARTLAHRYLSYFENYFMDRQRQGCLMVKYEEMISRQDELPARLKREWDIDSRWDTSPWLEGHRTTPDLRSSVERWQREPLPAEVDRFLREYLRDAMAHLGYQPGVTPATLPPSVEFRSGGSDPARVVCSAGGRLLPQEDATAAVIADGDFWMIVPLPAFETAAVREIWVSVKGAAGEVCSAYWRSGAEDFSEDRSMHVPYRGGLHWQVLRIPVAKHPLWKGTVAELRLDPFNWKEGSPRTPQTAFIRWLRPVG